MTTDNTCDPTGLYEPEFRVDFISVPTRAPAGLDHIEFRRESQTLIGRLNSHINPYKPDI